MEMLNTVQKVKINCYSMYEQEHMSHPKDGEGVSNYTT